MNCHRAHQSLSPYLDHQLTGAEMLEIQRHMEGCRSCAEEYRMARHIKELLRCLRVQEPVGPLETRIARRIVQEDAQAAWTLSSWSALPRTFTVGARPQTGRRLAAALALTCVALFAITPSFAPPATDVMHNAPLAFQNQASFGDQMPGTVLHASPVALNLLMTQSAPDAGYWRLNPAPPSSRATAHDGVPPLMNLGAEPLGDPAADGYVALADYSSH